jgi:hypothetical protein
MPHQLNRLRGMRAKHPLLVESRMKFMACTVEHSDSVADVRSSQRAARL